MTYDISARAVSQTGNLHLRDADDELLYTDADNPQDRLPCTVTLYGPGSKEYQKAQAKRQNRMVDRLKKRGKSDLTAEEQAKEQAEFLADCTADFKNFGYKGLTGREMAIALYSDPEMGFIPEQIGKHIGDWGNFKQSSPKS